MCCSGFGNERYFIVRLASNTCMYVCESKAFDVKLEKRLLLEVVFIFDYIMKKDEKRYITELF